MLAQAEVSGCRSHNVNLHQLTLPQSHHAVWHAQLAVSAPSQSHRCIHWRTWWLNSGHLTADNFTGFFFSARLGVIKEQVEQCLFYENSPERHWVCYCHFFFRQSSVSSLPIFSQNLGVYTTKTNMIFFSPPVPAPTFEAPRKAPSLPILDAKKLCKGLFKYHVKFIPALQTFIPTELVWHFLLE